MDWNKQDIYDFTQGTLTIDNQPTFQRYKIKVQAVNEKCESNIAVKEVDGYSGEDSKYFMLLIMFNTAFKWPQINL